MRIRLDERLIHGQVIAGVIKFYEISNVVVVSNSVKKDPVRTRLMYLALPAHLTLHIFSVQEFIEHFEEFKDGEHTLVIFETLPELFFFLEAVSYRGEIHIANYHSPKGEVRLKPTFVISEDEAKKLDKLAKEGISFVYKLTPQQKDEVITVGGVE